MPASPILGGHGQSRSLNLADNQCYNLYASLHETKDGKALGALYMTPGLLLQLTAGNGPVRAMHVASGTLYAVSGNSVYSVTQGLAATKIGTIATSTGPVSIIDSGPFKQVAFFDGQAGYLYASGVFSALNLPFSGPVQATYQDDFGLAYAAGTQKWFQSNAGDLSTWQALVFTSSDGSADNVGAIISTHQEIWVFKQNHTEIWVDGGTSPFAFQRLSGVCLQQGIAATFSVAIGGKENENLFWLSSSEAGQGRVVMAQGYAAQTISTVAMENEIATYSTISDAIAYCYEQEGEAFYVLTFPTAGVTWCYTVRANIWHKRASFSNGVWGRHWGNCYAYFAGLCLVGDYQSGNIYSLNLDAATDNGTQRKWLRSWRALAQTSPRPVRFNALLIDMETGGQVVEGFAPQLMLRWSDDGGHNWASQVIQAAGATGQTAKRVKFNRLGSTKRNGGLDRIFELSSADAFKVAIMGAFVE